MSVEAFKLLLHLSKVDIRFVSMLSVSAPFPVVVGPNWFEKSEISSGLYAVAK